MDDPTHLHLTKHHGAGNDFLVLLDADDVEKVSAVDVAALCHRHLGVGADGFIRGVRSRSGADLAMELRNADGSLAEMSGNGIRCLVQAAVDAGWITPGALSVDTDAGRHLVNYHSGQDPGTGYAEVDMGRPELGAELVLEEPAGLQAARAVDMGNPHLVLLVGDRPDDDVVQHTGSQLERSVPGGSNVEFVWSIGPAELGMRVWERGVGETLACGTGTCAAAAAAATWGLGDAEFTVHNPGGILRVRLDPDGAVLGGPTVHVADVTIDRAMLGGVGSVRSSAPLAHEVTARQ